MLLWDAECGLCRRSVAFVTQRAASEVLAAVSYQEAGDWLPDAVRARAAEQAYLRSPDGRYFGGGAALAPLLGLLGHDRLAGVARSVVARPLVDLGYRFVARHRALLGRLLRRI